MHNIKLNQVANLTRNSRTNQISLNLKRKQLKKFGLEPKDLLDMNLPRGMLAIPKPSASPQLERLQLRAGQLNKEAFK